MNYLEKRERPRVDLRLECRISATDLPRCGMIIENISRTGILVVWNQEQPGCTLPALGDLLTVEIELPAHNGFVQKCILCKATVVRISAAGPDAPRVALSVNSMRFRANRDGSSRMLKLEAADQAAWAS